MFCFVYHSAKDGILRSPEGRWHRCSTGGMQGWDGVSSQIFDTPSSIKTCVHLFPIYPTQLLTPSTTRLSSPRSVWAPSPAMMSRRLSQSSIRTRVASLRRKNSSKSHFELACGLIARPASWMYSWTEIVCWQTVPAELQGWRQGTDWCRDQGFPEGWRFWWWRQDRSWWLVILKIKLTANFPHGLAMSWVHSQCTSTLKCSKNIKMHFIES